MSQPRILGLGKEEHLPISWLWKTITKSLTKLSSMRKRNFLKENWVLPKKKRDKCSGIKLQSAPGVSEEALVGKTHGRADCASDTQEASPSFLRVHWPHPELPLADSLVVRAWAHVLLPVSSLPCWHSKCCPLIPWHGIYQVGKGNYKLSFDLHTTGSIFWKHKSLKGGHMVVK